MVEGLCSDNTSDGRDLLVTEPRIEIIFVPLFYKERSFSKRSNLKECIFTVVSKIILRHQALNLTC